MKEHGMTAYKSRQIDMNVFSFPSPAKRTDNANNATHYAKLGHTRKRRKSSKRNYYIISPRVRIKAIIIIYPCAVVSAVATLKHPQKFQNLGAIRKRFFSKRATVICGEFDKRIWYQTSHLEVMSAHDILSHLATFCQSFLGGEY